VLISHSHRFIYVKTRKTAGTSVEVYFEPYCRDPERGETVSRRRTPEVSDRGVVSGGSRFFWERNRVWFNHMPAEEIRAALDPETWAGYLKFCVVRNPFDKVVSSFWWRIPARERSRLDEAPFDEVRAAFARWVGSPYVSVRARARRKPNEHIPTDRPIVAVDGDLGVDEVIRHETLETDMGRVCERLGVPWEPDRLGRFKSGYWTRPEPAADYYDDATVRRVRDLFAWELETFGYDAP